MSRGGPIARRFSLLSVAVAAALTAAPSDGSGATRVGQTVDPSPSPLRCTSDDTWLQQASPNDQFVIPFNGVITSWSFRGGTAVPSQLKLKVGRVGTSSLTITGESALEAPAANQLNTFSTRIPSHAGEVIGFYFASAVEAQCALRQVGYTNVLALGDIRPGGAGSPITAEGNHLDVSAMLEPDCDRDGLGDESQDNDLSGCPTCKGRRATIVGGRRNDVLSGASGADVIVGLAGRDKLNGLAGNDVICGGSGKDALSGGKGKDILLGQSGGDKLKGGPGKDKLNGGAGKDKQIQ